MSLFFSIENNEEENWSVNGGVLPTNAQNIINRTCEQSGCLKGNRSDKETDTYNQKRTTENSGTLYEDCRPGEFNIHRSEFLMKTREAGRNNE